MSLASDRRPIRLNRAFLPGLAPGLPRGDRIVTQSRLFATPNPCRGVCECLPDSQYCRGCFRTRSERQNWDRLTDDCKVAVLRACRIRRRNYIRKSRPDLFPGRDAAAEPAAGAVMTAYERGPDGALAVNAVQAELFDGSLDLEAGSESGAESGVGAGAPTRSGRDLDLWGNPVDAEAMEAARRAEERESRAPAARAGSPARAALDWTPPMSVDLFGESGA